ncbi:MAG TPA: proton-conducting transporter membrane subunit [Bacteroidales bacterium]|nr:NADH/ubiquinone/plastoquinone (complex I) [Bacteroidales bacterium]HOU95915.1 proton-conducting transporter membrane subunit [Bacteroidales bacterium]HQG36863.1 proton-conducting transporter membrane subunit [Bacteroidales bacterium]HQG52647.1 proton-conducting transporter membrane subunit [Bacteroidales bacterium]HQJ20669.1 proton-conducting transporter membrane subunit [Bacteroidales bacterium]
MNPLIPLFVAVPLGGAFLTMIIGKFLRNANKYIGMTVLLFLMVISYISITGLSGNISVYKVGGWEPVNGTPIGIYMVLDSLSAILLCIINTIGFLSIVYSFTYIAQYTSENYFYSLFCLMVAGMNGIVLSGDIFNIYIFLEISAISSYALVAFGVEREQLEATFKYQVLGGLASMLILIGISFIYWKAKTLNIADIKAALGTNTAKSFYIPVQLLLLSGFGLKAAIIPFHAWLPDAHSSAPSPISAMLSGVLIKAAGIYVILRLFFNMFIITEDMAMLLTTLGALSMAVGVLLAIGQWDIKRLLAYHSISQMGYVVMSAGIGMILLARGTKPEVASLAIAGGLFHLINHAAFKSLLFLNAGAIEYRTGTRDLKSMGGLAGLMPATSSTSFVASMAISGIPPFNGFFSKLIIIIAAIMGKFYFLAVIAVIVSIVTLASFMKFQRYAFYNKEIEKSENSPKEVPFPMVFSMVTLAVLCLVLSLIALPQVRDVILTPAIRILTDSQLYTTSITGM